MLLLPQDFRDILVISRKRSLKAAALELGIDPSTMGRRLEIAERRMGASLFVRTPRGLEPTPEGLGVVAAADKIEAIEHALERELLSRDSSKANELIVTSAEWGVPILTPVLLMLAVDYPHMRMRLRIDNRALDLMRREADVALRIGRPTEAALMGRRIGVIRYGLYASSRYIEEKGRPRSIDDLSSHLFCTLDATYARAPNIRWQAALAQEARVVFQTNSMLSLVEAVRSGGGIAALPCVLGDASHDLERLVPKAAAVERGLWLIFHRDLRKSRGVRTIADALVARMRATFA